MSGPIPAKTSPSLLAAATDCEHWWCASGRSKSQPLCDGSHRGGRLAPVPLIVAADMEVWLCGRMPIGGKPLCDGTHNRL